MKRLHYILLLLAALINFSCERRELEVRNDPGKLAIIPIHIDWSQSQLEQNSESRASVWLFPKDGGAPMENHYQGNITDIELKVPVGEYAIIIMNETVSDSHWKGFVEFRGTDKFETFGAYLLEDDSNLAKVRGKGNTYHKTAKGLAAWSIGDFVVTQQMVDITRSRSSAKSRSGDYTRAEEETVNEMLSKVATAIMQPMVRSVFVKAKVKNLNSSQGATAVFNGAAHGVMLATGKVITTAVTHIMAMNNRQWEENKKDGTIESRFMTFGLLDTEDIVVNMNFLMHDGTWLEDKHDFNVTETVNNSQEYEIVINIGEPKDDQPDDQDHDIVLPSSSVEVGEWDEEFIHIK